MPAISLRALASGGSRWWACPFVQVRGIPGDGTDPAQALERVFVRVLNPFSQPATALVVFRHDDQPAEDLTGQVAVPPRSVREYEPNGIGVDFAGWLSVTADRPVIVSGVQAILRQVDVVGPGVNATSTVWERLPLPFHPGDPEA